MELNNLFDMVKADRYTADGCDQIMKAQEAETKDVKYQNGDISQKTGLMKTPNGWVEPPKGKQPASKPAEKGTRVDQWLKENPANLSNEALMRKNETLHELSKSADGEDFKKIMNAGIAIEEELGKRKLPTNPAGIGYEDAKKVAKEIAEHREAAQYYRRKAGSFSETDPSYNTYLQKALEYEDKANELAGIPAHRGMSAEDYDKKLRAEGWKGDWEGDGSRAFGYFKKDGKTIRVSQNGSDGSIGDVVEIKQKTSDSAPRLTGDTRIKVRK